MSSYSSASNFCMKGNTFWFGWGRAERREQLEHPWKAELVVCPDSPSWGLGWAGLCSLHSGNDVPLWAAKTPCLLLHFSSRSCPAVPHICALRQGCHSLWSTFPGLERRALKRALDSLQCPREKGCSTHLCFWLWCKGLSGFGAVEPLGTDTVKVLQSPEHSPVPPELPGKQGREPGCLSLWWFLGKKGSGRRGARRVSRKGGIFPLGGAGSAIKALSSFLCARWTQGHRPGRRGCREALNRKGNVLSVKIF